MGMVPMGVKTRPRLLPMKLIDAPLQELLLCWQQLRAEAQLQHGSPSMISCTVPLITGLIWRNMCSSESYPFTRKLLHFWDVLSFPVKVLLQMVTTKTAAFGFPINGTHSMDHPLCRQCSANRGLSLRCSQSELGEAHFKYVYLCKIM